jgi:hypothetical protein
MLKGLALTPPVVGRISIGRVVERDGRRVPERDDEFTITTQVQGRDGWIPHPLDRELRGEGAAKLRTLPVWLPFNDPELVLRANYSLFDRRTGRPQCVGNGETCRRLTADGVQTMGCPSPDGCSMAAEGACKPYARLNVRIGMDDELGTFVFRTTGFNSIRTLAARLHYLHALSGGLLAALPLELRLRGKSTAQSFGTPIFYVDLTCRTGSSLPETLAQAKELDAMRKASGFDQEALDRAAREGLARGAFEESAEEGEAVVEEFFPMTSAVSASSSAHPVIATSTPPRNLREKLSEKAVTSATQINTSGEQNGN